MVTCSGDLVFQVPAADRHDRTVSSSLTSGFLCCHGVNLERFGRFSCLLSSLELSSIILMILDYRSDVLTDKMS